MTLYKFIIYSLMHSYYVIKCNQKLITHLLDILNYIFCNLNNDDLKYKLSI